jgi:glutamate/tyrosine decarboxylase-like PLP-dependent enzyme
VALQRLGVDGVGAIYDALCDAATSLASKLRAQADVTVVHAPESNILAWELNGQSPDATAALRRELNAGTSWVTATRISGKPCLRVTIMNARTQDADLARLVQEQSLLMLS